MKIVKIVGNAFINTVPAKLGDDVKAYDMLDTREATVVFDDGTEIIGMCTRLVDLNLAATEPITEEVVQTPSPAISPVEPAEETTAETPVKTTEKTKG